VDDLLHDSLLAFLPISGERLGTQIRQNVIDALPTSILNSKRNQYSLYSSATYCSIGYFWSSVYNVDNIIKKNLVKKKKP
jgi:hypothetical protein